MLAVPPAVSATAVSLASSISPARTVATSAPHTTAPTSQPYLSGAYPKHQQHQQHQQQLAAVSAAMEMQRMRPAPMRVPVTSAVGPVMTAAPGAVGSSGSGQTAGVFVQQQRSKQNALDIDQVLGTATEFLNSQQL